MFGYVQIRKSELKIKDYEIYKGFYCGLCKVLKQKYGFTGQITLTYDMTFLIILLSSVYEVPVNVHEGRCFIHPLGKKKFITNEVTEFAADMNIILSFYNFEDNYNDEGSGKARIGMKLYKRRKQKAAGIYGHKEQNISSWLNELAKKEKTGDMDIFGPADCFGNMMKELFIFKQDIFTDILSQLAFHLGRFIYIMDAYDDLEEDIKKGSFNPLKPCRSREDYHEYIEAMLHNEMAQAASEYRKLPCMQYSDILGNILYAGVWNRFDKMKAEREKQQREKNSREET